MIWHSVDILFNPPGTHKVHRQVGEQYSFHHSSLSMHMCSYCKSQYITSLKTTIIKTQIEETIFAVHPTSRDFRQSMPKSAEAVLEACGVISPYQDVPFLFHLSAINVYLV